MKKKVLFITGTRADFGKQKALMHSIEDHPDFTLEIFCTGMHLMSKYGYTVSEIQKAGFENKIFHFLNQVEGESMEIILSNTIAGLSRYLHENPVDLIIIHGDRIEALAGATVGALRNILVGHIEGGEVSGTIDDLLRHATSKMAHIHFVASSSAKQRLLQLGENTESIFQIGSPDVDVMLSHQLPSIAEAKKRYDIFFKNYAIAILHPVTTEYGEMARAAKTFFQTLLESKRNYVIIYPNNDLGSKYINNEIDNLKNNVMFKIFPSIRFEYFLTLLKRAEFIIGNSSTGIHEAPIYGVPTIDIGSRQKNRFNYKSIKNVDFNKIKILTAIDKALKKGRYQSTTHYGNGNSAKAFVEILESDKLWNIKKQKQFIDIN